jgi:hypothetical protein
VSNSQNVTVSFPFLGMLTLLFIGLKLTNQIYWSWVWVLAPMWAPIALLFLVLAIVLIAKLVVAIFE